MLVGQPVDRRFGREFAGDGRWVADVTGVGERDVGEKEREDVLVFFGGNPPRIGAKGWEPVENAA